MNIFDETPKIRSKYMRLAITVGDVIDYFFGSCAKVGKLTAYSSKFSENFRSLTVHFKISSSPTCLSLSLYIVVELQRRWSKRRGSPPLFVPEAAFPHTPHFSLLITIPVPRESLYRTRTMFSVTISDDNFNNFSQRWC
jgi:hypothetical protein